MSLDVAIDLENSSALLGLSRLHREQLPYAQALALTRTAQVAQRAEKTALPSRFEIRSNYLERGIRIQAATKRRPEAVVFWRGAGGSSGQGFATALARQETGGIKRPKGRAIALPRGIQRGSGGRITKANRPAGLLSRKRVFIRDVKGGAAILRRVGRGRPRLLYFLTRRPAKIEARFEFRATAREAAAKAYPKEFGRAFARAIATRK